MTKRVAELDGIRGVAIAMVIIWHYFTCLQPNMAVGSFFAYLPKLTALFYSGVDLFFVLFSCSNDGFSAWDNHTSTKNALGHAL